jgi:hypothetical protein
MDSAQGWGSRGQQSRGAKRRGSDCCTPLAEAPPAGGELREEEAPGGSSPEARSAEDQTAALPWPKRLAEGGELREENRRMPKARQP